MKFCTFSEQIVFRKHLVQKWFSGETYLCETHSQTVIISKKRNSIQVPQIYD